MSERNRLVRIAFSALAAFGVWSATPAKANDYYAGKTIQIYAGRPPGGGIDAEMRLVAQFIGNFIPGHPRVLPMNMPGGGGVVLANWLYNVAPKDGTALGVPGRTSFLVSPMVENPNARYDLTKFTWIGSAASSNFMLWIRKPLGITNLQQLMASKKKIVIGGSSGGNSDTVIPELLAKYSNMPLNVVKGYPGTAEQALALQRGEIDGMFTELASFAPGVIEGGLAVPVLQTFPEKEGLPTTDDIAKNPREKAMIDLFGVSLKVGLALVAPPGTNPDATKALREAYIKMVSSPDYVAEAKRRGFDVGKPNPGDDIEKFLASKSHVSDDVKAEFKTYAGD